jgi:hypothetical protein
MTLAPLVLALAVSIPVPPRAGETASPQTASVPVSAEDARERVSGWLGTIHGAVSPDAFRALGPAGVDALVEFARTDPSPIRRLRALEALAALGGARAEAVHREVLASDAPSAVRRGAVRGLARLAGPSEASAALAPFLERDRDPAVRAVAAEALARTAPAAGCGPIRARAKVDPEPARFGPALAACDRAGQLPAR